jgi:hypothetical protein
VLADVGLDHVRDLVGDELLALELLLGCGIAALKPGGQDLLGFGSGGVERGAAIRADGVLAQGRAGASRSVEDDEDLLALGRDLEAEARQDVVPEHGLLGRGGECVDAALEEADAGQGRSRLLPGRNIGSSREASGGLSVNADPEVA